MKGSVVKLFNNCVHVFLLVSMVGLCAPVSGMETEERESVFYEQEFEQEDESVTSPICSKKCSTTKIVSAVAMCCVVAYGIAVRMNKVSSPCMLWNSLLALRKTSPETIVDNDGLNDKTVTQETVSDQIDDAKDLKSDDNAEKSPEADNQQPKVSQDALTETQDQGDLFGWLGSPADFLKKMMGVKSSIKQSTLDVLSSDNND